MNGNSIIGNKSCPFLMLARNISIQIANAAHLDTAPPPTCLKSNCAIWDTRNHQCGLKPVPAIPKEGVKS